MLPPKLQIGDTIGVIAPSGSFVRERLQPGLAYLHAQGYPVREGGGLYAQERYLAGKDTDRAADVNAMFADPDIRAIFVARGGYGSARLLLHLDWDTLVENPKILVGFSDTTALQLGLFARIGLASFSGLALCSDVTVQGIHPLTESSLWAAVCNHQFDPIDVMPLRAGNIQGVLIGGCLSLVTSLIGTPFSPRFDGAILFLEDVNEPLYRIDRLLTQLRLSGIMDRVAGVVFGQFYKCDPEREAEGTVQDILDDFASQVLCPVYMGLPYGHGVGRRVMPIGLAGWIENGRLTFGTWS